MDCNAATRNVPPWFCGGGVSGIPAAVRRDVHCRSSGCLERGVLMPCTI